MVSEYVKRHLWLCRLVPLLFSPSPLVSFSLTEKKMNYSESESLRLTAGGLCRGWQDKTPIYAQEAPCSSPPHRPATLPLLPQTQPWLSWVTLVAVFARMDVSSVLNGHGNLFFVSLDGPQPLQQLRQDKAEHSLPLKCSTYTHGGNRTTGEWENTWQH